MKERDYVSHAKRHLVNGEIDTVAVPIEWPSSLLSRLNGSCGLNF